MVNKEDYIKEIKRQYKEERLSRYSQGNFEPFLWNDFVEQKMYDYYRLVYTRIKGDK